MSTPPGDDCPLNYATNQFPSKHRSPTERLANSSQFNTYICGISILTLYWQASLP